MRTQRLSPSPEPRHVGGLDGAVREVTRRARGCARVLIVEPDPELQFRMARHLTVRGHRVVGATSVAASHALMREWDVDVVVLDERVAHTDEDGAGDLAAVARRFQEAQPWARVVVMGHAPELERRLGAPLAGAVTLLVKPLRLEALGELLDQLVAQLRLGLAEAPEPSGAE